MNGGILSPQELVAGGIEVADLVANIGLEEAQAAEILERVKSLQAAKEQPPAESPA